MLLVLFLLVAALRLAGLAASDPLHRADTARYVEYAEILLSGAAWLHDADAGRSPMPRTLFDSIAYPAVIAAARVLFGERFDTAVVVLQTIATALVSVLLFRLLFEIGIAPSVSFAFVLAFSLSAILLADLSLMNDSLFASSFLCVVLTIAHALLRGRRLGTARLLALGLLFALSVLLRPAALYMTPFVALGVVLASSEPGLRCRLAHALVFVLPTLAAWGTYNLWNLYRVGEPLFTTIAQANLIRPPLAIEMAGTSVLAAGSPVTAAYEAVRHRHAEAAADGPARAGPLAVLEGPRYPDEWPLTKDVVHHMFSELGLTAPEMAREAQAAFFALAWNHPLALLRYAWAEVWPEQLRAVIDFKRGLPAAQGKSSRLPPLPAWALWGAEAMTLAVSPLLVMAFVVGGPMLVLARALRRRPLPPALVVLAWFLLLYAAFVGMYALVHLEARHVIAPNVLALAGGLLVLTALAARLRRRTPAA